MHQYAAINYVDAHSRRYAIEDIANELKNGRHIVLLGEFGTGKSRCLMEVFRTLVAENPTFPPVAINLRDNWGLRKHHLIINNHLDGLGLGGFTDALVRSLHRGNHIVLLDGFDEIGSQSWSGDAKRLTEIRKKSLEGVRDLISNINNTGFLIVGREHYFATSEEMSESLGLNLSDALILRCPEEFSDSELAEYIQVNTTLKTVPEWMPRKPLICQLLTRLPANEVQRLETGADGEIEFFESILDTICARETRIHPSIYKESLKGILLLLSQQTRALPSSDERMSTEDINQAFYAVTGSPPIDESALLLQRLPYLGRAGSGGSDRIFIDDYAKNGLRALALVQAIRSNQRDIGTKRWVQPLDTFGLRVLHARGGANADAERFAKLCMNHGNSQIACDLVAARLLASEESCDFQGLSVVDGRIKVLAFVDVNVKNLHLASIEVEELTLEAATFSSVKVEFCTVDCVKGMGGVDKLPDVFVDCDVGVFDTAITVARISELNLTEQQKTLLAIVKKLFFQPGAGRKEEALLRGAEKYWHSAAAKVTVQYLESNGLMIRTKGSHGIVYVPKRKHRPRMAALLEMQTSCGDELWEIVSRA
ncbi:hypothetical protein [Achromobacter mucicolens]|uniref:hypothetical protein n=1 Tax=Achromobacter mucicolens TaxID=1389922 RepID=UPI00242B4A83|nr:hypothetical protein [Achromobacter mucicolens]